VSRAQRDQHYSTELRHREIVDEETFREAIAADLDWPALTRLLDEQQDRRPNKTKYLDAEKWLLGMWRDAVRLDLNRLSSQRVLDLGTGPGYFPYVCRLLGHEALALDKPGVALHESLSRWLGVDVTYHRIAARTPLPRLERRVDLVTAFRVGFNAKGERGVRTLFDLDDWAFFLDDIRDHVLEPRGRLVLKMISQGDYSGPKFGDDDLTAFFEARGGHVQIERHVVLFDPLR
jgi:hypothetical protein